MVGEVDRLHTAALPANWFSWQQSGFAMNQGFHLVAKWLRTFSEMFLGRRRISLLITYWGNYFVLPLCYLSIQVVLFVEVLKYLYLRILHLTVSQSLWIIQRLHCNWSWVELPFTKEIIKLLKLCSVYTKDLSVQKKGQFSVEIWGNILFIWLSPKKLDVTLSSWWALWKGFYHVKEMWVCELCGSWGSASRPQKIFANIQSCNFRELPHSINSNRASWWLFPNKLVNTQNSKIFFTMH